MRQTVPADTQLSIQVNISILIMYLDFQRQLYLVYNKLPTSIELVYVKGQTHGFKIDISLVRGTIDRTFLTRASYQFIEPENQWTQKCDASNQKNYLL